MAVTEEGPAGWDGHVLLVHGNEAQRRLGVAAWVARGLDLDAKILYVEPPDPSPDRAFLEVLRAAGIEVADALERGQIEVVPASKDVYTSDWQTDTVDRALAEGYPTVRLSAQSTTAGEQMSPEVHADLELSTDERCRTRPFSVLCQYPHDLLEATLEAVCGMHGEGLRDALLRTFPVPDGIALVGEVDASNAKILRCALGAATARAAVHDDFVIDMSDLAFLDVAGVRALLAGTSNRRRNGGVISLLAPRRAVHGVLSALDVGRDDLFDLGGPQ